MQCKAVAPSTRYHRVTNCRPQSNRPGGELQDEKSAHRQCSYAEKSQFHHSIVKQLSSTICSSSSHHKTTLTIFHPDFVLHNDKSPLPSPSAALASLQTQPCPTSTHYRVRPSQPQSSSPPPPATPLPPQIWHRPASCSPSGTSLHTHPDCPDATLYLLDKGIPAS
jgi:hypothetical protein